MTSPISPTTIILILDLLGTAVFAVTGAIRAFKSHLDFFGVVVLACAVGVGGGMMRDALIGATPVSAIHDARYLLVCVVTGIAMFFITPHLNDRWNIVPMLDALGLGVFTAIGAEKAAAYGLPGIAVVLCGVLTAVGGGVIRDVMVMRIPAVLCSDFYATASALGGVVFLLLYPRDLDFFWRFVLVTTFVTLLRLLAMRFRFRLPEAHVTSSPRKRRHRITKE